MKDFMAIFCYNIQFLSKGYFQNKTFILYFTFDNGINNQNEHDILIDNKYGVVEFLAQQLAFTILNVIKAMCRRRRNVNSINKFFAFNISDEFQKCSSHLFDYE